VSELKEHEVVLYLRKNQSVDFEIPKNLPAGRQGWKIKVINFPMLWTQLGLSLEMLLHPADILFIPAHTVPFIHPRNTIVTIHGLEYEFCPEAYSFLERLYMRCSIKNSCKWAKKIIAVSENTKKDLMKLYNVPEEKIRVIYEGYSEDNNQETKNNNQTNHKPQTTNYKPYLLFVGRLEERKNVINIINAFEILKEQYKIPHKLILAGKPGFGYEKIKDRIANANCQKDIVELGFVSEEEKWELLKNADVFVFPTLYEGFGIPILEAQSFAVPVVASNNSSIKEITSMPFSPQMRRDVPQGQRGDGEDCSALLVDPNNAEEIADAIYKIISDEKLKQDLIQKGLENIKRFSWEKCAREVESILKT
jgi:glycosyltransferase involved in cell wall biosynthesis